MWSENVLTYLVFLLKYLLLSVACGLFPITRVGAITVLFVVISLDCWDNALTFEKGRKSMMHDMVRDKIDEVVREERANAKTRARAID